MLKIDVWSIVFTIINLVVLFVAMKFILFKPVKKILDERQEEADRQFAEAAKHQQEADEMKAQYEQSVSGVEQERKKVLLEARKNADAEYQRIVNDAKNAAQELKQDAVVEAENQRQQILKKAQSEIADMVVDAAAKVVGGKKGADVDKALYNKFLDKAGDEA